VKLLLDQNLSHRLVEFLSEPYPGNSHVRLLSLECADDERVWNFARDNGFTIVPKDSDFHQRSLLYGFPPKFIWLRIGNCSTRAIQQLLARYRKSVQTFCPVVAPAHQVRPSL